MKFDPKKIAQLKAGTSIGIDDCPGLRIVVSKTKNTWIYRYRVDDSLKQIKLGEWPGMTKSQAIAAWGVARTNRENGIDAAAEKKAKRQPSAVVEQPTTYTVRKLSLDYLASIERTRSASSLQSVTRLFKRLLDPIAGHEPHTVTRADAYALIEGISDKPALAIKFKAELAQAWDFGIDAGKCPEAVNWWRQVMRGKLRSTGHIRGGERTTTKRVLAPAEVKTILAWLPLQPSPLSDVLTLYLWTGARGGELVQMEGREVGEEDGQLWWTCPKSKTKNKNVEQATDFRVPLVGRAAAIVKARKLQHGDGYLFPGAKKGHVSQNAIGEALSRRQPYNGGDLKVSHWAPHDLRRTARTTLAQLGAPHEVGEVILGHVLGGVAQVYNRHGYDAEKVVWLTKLSDHLETLTAS